MNGNGNGNGNGRARPPHAALQPRDVCIVGAARTPMGSLQGSLASISATRLGSIAIEAALKRSGVDKALVQEVILGNVLAANLGQAPARQAALGAGLPEAVVCTSVNKVCASGMKATVMAAQSILLGLNDVVVAGGMESMTNCPYYIPKARQGYRMGNGEIVDGMQRDGLWDPYSDCSMGNFAELCAAKHGITREEQDDHAISTFTRAIEASDSGAFDWEIAPVEIAGAKGKPSVMVCKDDALQKFDAVKLRQLRTPFKENGTVTAGNASGINDGAAALVLVSGAKALELGLHVIAKIRGFSDVAQAPEEFTTSPSVAVPIAIRRAGVEMDEVDFFEINEAFSVVAVSNQRLLGIDPERLNVHGGAVALGHPLGCSGARILVTLLGVLRRHGGHIGVAAVCNGGGGASAMVLEALSAY
eukprot:SM000044S15996  [mRNA]  locus=s44:430346:433993:- [translate_table: standard]